MDEGMAQDALETVNYAIAGALASLDEAKSALEDVAVITTDRAILKEAERLHKIASDAALEATGKADGLIG